MVYLIIFILIILAIKSLFILCEWLSNMSNDELRNKVNKVVKIIGGE